jgi:hypothetical protein
VLVFFFALLFLTMRKWIAITALVLTIAGVDSEPLHTPRQFDYYVLSLSWSPQYCAGSNGRNDSKQCGTGRRFGFVVHGLWPNNNRPPHPSNCAPSSSVPPDLVKDMLRINAESQTDSARMGFSRRLQWREPQGLFRSYAYRFPGGQHPAALSAANTGPTRVCRGDSSAIRRSELRVPAEQHQARLLGSVFSGSPGVLR